VLQFVNRLLQVLLFYLWGVGVKHAEQRLERLVGERVCGYQLGKRLGRVLLSTEEDALIQPRQSWLKTIIRIDVCYKGLVFEVLFTPTLT
jgi:hypothetical protein